MRHHIITDIGYKPFSDNSLDALSHLWHIEADVTLHAQGHILRQMPYTGAVGSQL